MKTLFKRADFFVIAAVSLLSLLLFLPSLFNNEGLTAVVYADGEIIREIDLDKVEKGYTFTVKGNTQITVNKGEIFFSRAECEDELCIKSGVLSAKGQTAACLPQKIVIAIKGHDKTDMMTY